MILRFVGRMNEEMWGDLTIYNVTKNPLAFGGEGGRQTTMTKGRERGRDLAERGTGMAKRGLQESVKSTDFVVLNTDVTMNLFTSDRWERQSQRTSHLESIRTICTYRYRDLWSTTDEQNG